MGHGGERRETERFRAFPLHALRAAKDSTSGIFWLKDDSLEDPDLLPPPGEAAAEVVESLEAALASFRSVAAKLQGASGGSGAGIGDFTQAQVTLMALAPTTEVPGVWEGKVARLSTRRAA